MIECAPAESDDVPNVAVVTPAVVDSVPVPSVFDPSLKVTVPVGLPVAGATALIVAVNVTDWPTVDGLTLEATVVVVLA